MKKMTVAFLLLLAGLVAAGIWYSPLADGASVYSGNEEVACTDGAVYPAYCTVRRDFDGSPDDMYAALDKLFASPVFTAELDGLTVVYAYSPRVCAHTLHTAAGEAYNVMAAYRAGHICIGTPALEGSY